MPKQQLKKLKISYRKDRNTYCLYLYKIGGGRKYYSTYELAQKDADKIIEQYNKDLYIPNTITGKQGVDKWLEEQTDSYLRGYFLPQELQHRKNIAKKFLLITINDITISEWDLSELLTHPRSASSITKEITKQIFSMNISNKTMKGHYSYFRYICKFFVENNWTQQSIMTDSKFRTQKNFVVDDKAIRISKENIEKIISHVKPKYKLAIRFSAYTGLRQGEQRELRWKDINFENNTISVHRALQRNEKGIPLVGKTKSINGQRVVPLNTFLANELRQLSIAQGRPESDKLVFINDDDNYMADRTLRRQLTNACKLAQVKKIRWHDLRHYYASKLLEIYGKDLHKVTTFMGHGNIETTRKNYGHWLEDKERNAEDVAKLDAAFTL